MQPGAALPSSAMPTIAVIGSSQTPPDHPDYQDGVRLGARLAEAGFTVATGGYGGLMEAVSAGARSAGGKVIGVTAPQVFPGRDGVNRYVTDEQPFPTLTERIHHLVSTADAVVALPGSIGTLTELMAAWNTAYVAPFSGKDPKPIVAVGPLWEEIVSYLTEKLATNGDLVHLAADVDTAAVFVVKSLRTERGAGKLAPRTGGALQDEQ